VRHYYKIYWKDGQWTKRKTNDYDIVRTIISKELGIERDIYIDINAQVIYSTEGYNMEGYIKITREMIDKLIEITEEEAFLEKL